MITEQLSANMKADLSLPIATSTANEIRSLGIKYPKARKAFVKIWNEYLELNRVFREGSKMRPAANKDIEDLCTRVAEAVFVAMALPQSNLPDSADDEYTDNFVFDLEKSKELLRKYNPHKEKMQQEVLKNSHVVTYAPVLPLTKPFLQIDKLKAIGFQATSFEGYAVLEKQLVIGVSNENIKKRISVYTEMREGLTDMLNAGKKAARSSVQSGSYAVACVEAKSETMRVCLSMKSNEVCSKALDQLRDIDPTKSTENCNQVLKLMHEVCLELKGLLSGYSGPLTEEALLKSLLQSASALTKQKLVVLGSPVNFMGATWQWVATSKEIAMMQRCAMGGHFAMTRWTFAFGGMDKKS